MPMMTILACNKCSQHHNYVSRIQAGMEFSSVPAEWRLSSQLVQAPMTNSWIMLIWEYLTHSVGIRHHSPHPFLPSWSSSSNGLCHLHHPRQVPYSSVCTCSLSYLYQFSRTQPPFWPPHHCHRHEWGCVVFYVYGQCYSPTCNEILPYLCSCSH